jgi:hypothetical protein
VAATRLVCKSSGCGRRFRPRKGTRRVYCYDCRPERSPGGAASMSEAAAPVADRIDGPTAAAVRTELERAGQSGTVTAAVALRLAMALDDPGLGAAQVASMSAKLLQVMEPLARMGAQLPDEVDEFTARLAEKRASA